MAHRRRSKRFLRRYLFSIETIQDKLPSPIHYGCLNDFIVGNPCIRFRDQSKGQYRWGYRRLPSLCFPVQGSQFLPDVIRGDVSSRVAGAKLPS